MREDLSDDESPEGGVSLQSSNARPTIFFGRAHGVPFGLDEWHLAATSLTRCFDEDFSQRMLSAFTGIGRHESLPVRLVASPF